MTQGQAGTKSIIELVKEATGASEDDVKQSLEVSVIWHTRTGLYTRMRYFGLKSVILRSHENLQEHGGDVNATVNALLDGKHH
jgi:hypothetical protein